MIPDPFIHARSIHHDGSSRYVRSTYGADPVLGDEVLLRLRAAPEAPIRQILLRTLPDGEQQFTEMQLEEADGLANPVCRWWRIGLKLHMPLTSYRFLLLTEDGEMWWYNASGLHRNLVTDSEDFRILASYTAPSWVRDSVFYQIFPDRFANGNPSNDVRDGEFSYFGLEARAAAWGKPPLRGSRAAMVEFYGGDLAGIEQKLDYLQDLGINAIYLNPIFTAYSNHRYDVTDYFHVDQHLGGDQALRSLREATSGRDMRLILDVVPNHCGVLHPWFQAAVADPNAPTAEFFTFHDHPDEYESWLGVRSLPKLDYRSHRLREVIYRAQDSVFRYWLQPPYSIDGWRLDVANMLARQGANQLGEEVGRGIQMAVKLQKPEAYLLGENFFDGSPQLQGDMWDATMNYAGFTKPVWYWLNRFHVRQHGSPEMVLAETPWSTQALVDSWKAFRASIPWAIARQQFNLLGSHDTARILSTVEGSSSLNRLAVGLLMTYVGVPSVYYGDEIGLGGIHGDPRSCMAWDMQEWEHDLRAFYKTLIELRRSSPALVEGGFQVLWVGENSMTYLRDTDAEQIIVVAHRGPQDLAAFDLPVAHGAIADGAEFEEVIDDGRVRVSAGHLSLPAMPAGVKIWRTVS